MKKGLWKKLLAMTLAVVMALSVAPFTASAAWNKGADNSWSYTENGNKVTGWKKVINKWYYFDNSGTMQTGWHFVDGNWYYMDESGAMQAGWQFIDGEWYRLNESGAMLKGWIKENGVWWNKNEVIDIVAGSGLEAIVGDCYWRDYEVGIEELNKLEKKAKELSVLDREYFLFAKEGFSSELLDLAQKRNDIRLYSFHDMVKGQEMIEKPKKKGFFFRR